MKLHLLNLTSAVLLVVCFLTGEVHLPARVAVQPTAERPQTQPLAEGLNPVVFGQHPKLTTGQLGASLSFGYPGLSVGFSTGGGSPAGNVSPHRTFVRTFGFQPFTPVNFARPTRRMLVRC